MNKHSLFTNITDRIREHLKKGVVPWRRSWRVGLPRNYISKRLYRGINFLQLALEEYPSPYYLTFLQCQQLKGQILSGSKGKPIIFWSVKEYQDNDNEEIKTVPLMKTSHVFNLIETSLYNNNQDTSFEVLDCKRVIENMSNKPEITYSTLKCSYDPIKDKIRLPHIRDFETTEEYYSTLFHEIIHSTGHSTRLNRIIDYSEEAYAREELIAELGSAFLCGITGIEQHVLENQAAYINSWLKLIDCQPEALSLASVEAGRAVNFILGHDQLISSRL